MNPPPSAILLSNIFDDSQTPTTLVALETKNGIQIYHALESMALSDRSRAHIDLAFNSASTADTAPHSVSELVRLVTLSETDVSAREPFQFRK